jgi:anti-sigma factor RsiW
MAFTDDPPQSDTCSDIQAVLSEYLDGQLAAARSLLVKGHLERCLGCQEHYQLMVQVQSALFSSSEDETVVLPAGGFWNQIAGQLAADQQTAAQAAGLCEFDEEFISAYCDGVFSHTEEPCQRFEAHLVGCAPCNSLLGQFREAGDLLRQWSFRLEAVVEPVLYEQQLTARVIQQLQAPEEVEMPSADLVASGCSESMTIETLSAFVDDALEPKETMLVARHVEGCEPCKTVVHGFHELCACVQASAQRIGESVPDCWPAMAPVLAQEVGRVVPFYRRIPKWMSVPATAAAAVLILTVSWNQLFGVDPVAGNLAAQAPMAESTVDLAASESAPVTAEQRVAMKAKSASAEAGDSSADIVAWNSAPAGGAVMSAEPYGAGAASAPPMAPAPMEAEVDSVASKGVDSSARKPSPRRSRIVAQGMEVPTSEEYLYRVNHERMPADELPVIMGNIDN